MKVGGHYLYIGPANNMMGHGFFQFSPEFFYNYLSKNGFDDIDVFLSPFRNGHVVFRTADPREFGGRVELVNDEPVQIMVIARKAAHVAEQIYPIQSDYQNLFWKNKTVNRAKAVSTQIDPKLAPALIDLKKRIAALSAWPATVSADYMLGFENNMQYNAIDPGKD